VRRLALLALLAAGCHQGPEFNPQEVQTLEITLASDVNLGTEAMPNADRTLRFDMVARDRTGGVASGFNGKIQSYVFFAGTLSPDRAAGASSLQEIQVTGGLAQGLTLNLPTAFGPSSLWLEDAGEPDRAPTYAAGSTPTIWYREPYLSDVQRPPVPARASASLSNYHSILEGKQVRVNQSQHGVDGRLVVTSVDAQAYSVSDAKCGPGGTPPCTSVALGHLYVFTFSKPPVEVGSLLKEVRGGVTEFVGFTELSFPRQDLLKNGETPIIDARLVPTPVLLTPATVADNAVMEDNEAALVELRGVIVCKPASPDDIDRFERFRQFPIDLGTGSGCGGAGAPSLAMPSFTFDPYQNDGKRIDSVLGMVRNVAGDSSGGRSFSFWTINVRAPADVKCSTCI